jgi:dTDP-4-amino-4,6-dideoxygalactose transaminase
LWHPIFVLKNRLVNVAKSVSGVPSRAEKMVSAAGGYKFRSRWTDIGMSWPSTSLLSLLSSERCIESRRANFIRYLENLGDTPGGRALYCRLPEDVVPYVFPYLIENPSSVFPELKRRRVPLLRWEHAETTECAVSASYSQSLLFIPCHQELTPEDVDWISTQIREALLSDKKAANS